jgi:hypothetical protein
MGGWTSCYVGGNDNQAAEGRSSHPWSAASRLPHVERAILARCRDDPNVTAFAQRCHST